MQLTEDLVQRVFPFVERPARYTNNELYSIHKDWTAVDIKVAFCFPDLYEIGSANLGLQIFYSLINSIDYALLERVFCPAADCEALLRKHNIPLFSIESNRPMKDFSLLAFTLATELVFTNILNVLDLAGFPLRAADRGEEFPLVLAGGGGAYNPEPVADFFDFFVVGEGEEVFVEIIDLVRKLKSENKKKPEILRALANIEGIYVPTLFEVSYGDDGLISAIVAAPTVHPVVTKRYIKDMESVNYSSTPIVPFVEVVHDRAVVEIMRGCKHGCRFCQAGYVNRPVRERSAKGIIDYAKALTASTGHEELSLISLSSSDYSCIDEIASALALEMGSKRISLSLPSLRADSITESLSTQLNTIRKSGFTIAPEAGTQRLRDVINKNLSETDILGAVKNIFSSRAEAVKLYFMIGLPTETDEDILAIRDLAFKVVNVSKEIPGHKLKRVVVNVSFFVPKPHTPFQWSPMIDQAEIFRKVKLLKDILRHHKIDFKYHDIYTSLLEGVLSRGDRRLSHAIEGAYKLGCKMDAWRESFNYNKWLQAFADAGIDVNRYAHRVMAIGEVMPWEHISCGVTKKNLIAEYTTSLSGETSVACFDGCRKCGVC